MRTFWLCWYNDVARSRSLTLYKEYKQEFEYELYILKELRNATDKNIIFACLNDGLVKSLLKISYWVFIACDEIPKRHLMLYFTLQDENIWTRKMWR